MRVLQWIEGMSKVDRIRNVDLRGKLRQEGVLDLINRWQQKWKQRLEMSSGRVMKIVYDGEDPGKHPRERPRMRRSNNFA